MNKRDEADQKDIFAEIVKIRGFKELPNFYERMRKYPRLTAQFWESLRAITAPGALDEKTKELIAISVCVVLGARFCVDSHIAMAKKIGMTDAELEELLMVVNVYTQTAMICSAFNPPYDPSQYDGK